MALFRKEKSQAAPAKAPAAPALYGPETGDNRNAFLWKVLTDSVGHAYATVVDAPAEAAINALMGALEHPSILQNDEMAQRDIPIVSVLSSTGAYEALAFAMEDDNASRSMIVFWAPGPSHDVFERLAVGLGPAGLPGHPDARLYTLCAGSVVDNWRDLRSAIMSDLVPLQRHEVGGLLSELSAIHASGWPTP